MNIFIRILSLAALAVILDLPWLLGTSSWSGQVVRTIQGSPLELYAPAALIVYLAIGYLSTIPKSAVEAFLIGTSVYAVYDFTNLAILKNYSGLFAIADSLWGGILFTIVHLVARKLLPS